VGGSTPALPGELPELFHDIATDIRNQYTIHLPPTNTKLDGTYRKLKVELQAPDGGPRRFATRRARK